MGRLFRAGEKEIEGCFGGILTELLRTTRLGLSDSHIQHGDTSVLLHSAAVAYYSYRLSRRLGLLRHLRQKRELIRVALLHDYFLYDWHRYNNENGLHGFSHPATALANARRDTDVSPTEANIIARHMFPLTPVPPTCGAGWVICLVDKVCSIYETFNRGVYGELRSYLRRCQFTRSAEVMAAAA